MKTNEFMNSNLQTIKKIIQDLPKDSFDSHVVIQAIAKKFEPNYVRLLTLYKNTPHRIVHSQIASNLFKNKKYLAIEKNGKVSSATVFGINNPNQFWNKK